MRLKPFTLLVVALLFARSAGASVVLYEEGVQTEAFSIEKIGQKELIILSACPLDQPVKDLGICDKQKGLLPTSQLKDLVRAAALKAAVYRPEEDLSPIHRKQLDELAEVQAHLDDPANQKKLKELDFAFADLTDTLLDFIRHNGADGSPQTIKSSAMKNTLILQVMRRLAVADMVPDKITGEKIPADTKLGRFWICATAYSTAHPIWALYPSGKSDKIEDSSQIDPVVFALDDAVFVVSIQNGQVTLDSLGNSAIPLPSERNEEFVGIYSFSLSNREFSLVAHTKDGSSFQRLISVNKKDEVTEVSAEWEFLY